ncbi:MAG TPA: hypothetical protein VF727_10370 [Allosphingosinicella sp.]|jgi:hypothetical protein
MPRRAALLLSLFALGGCAGYAADYWKPKETLIGPQLPRYGISGEQGQCVEKGLTAALSVWQLRQLADLAKGLTSGGNNPAALTPRDFIYVAGLAEDPKVGSETTRVLQECNVAAEAAPAPATPPAEPQPSTPDTAAAAPPTPAQGGQEPLWVNLGAASTGQGIAVDATSVTRGPSWRQAWFRLLNYDQSGVGDVGYQLRIDCAAKTITAHAGRKYAPGGALTEERQYDKPEGPMPIEKGTVIEVAYHALCD